jgi:hypothetical protein
MELDTITGDSPALENLIDSRISVKVKRLDNMISRLTNQVNSATQKNLSKGAPSSARQKKTGKPKGKTNDSKADAAAKGTTGNQPKNGKSKQNEALEYKEECLLSSLRVKKAIKNLGPCIIERTKYIPTALDHLSDVATYERLEPNDAKRGMAKMQTRRTANINITIAMRSRDKNEKVKADKEDSPFHTRQIIIVSHGKANSTINPTQKLCGCYQINQSINQSKGLKRSRQKKRSATLEVPR